LEIYERLLMELGEINYTNSNIQGGVEKNNWPVELRLDICSISECCHVYNN